MGRFDLWLGRDQAWSVHAEAKHIWCGDWDPGRAVSTVGPLVRSGQQTGDLLASGWAKTVASLTFIVPNPEWRAGLAPSEVVRRFSELEVKLWAGHGGTQGTFQSHFVLPEAEIRPLGEKVLRAYPGVILFGNVRQAESAL